MKNRDIYWRKYKKHCTQDNDASVPFKAGTLGPHTVLPVAISYPLAFSWIPSMVWNLFPFKGDFNLGKARSQRVSNLGCREAESPGWFDVLPKNSPGDVMHEQAHCLVEAANHQLPIAAAFWIIRIVSMEECSNLMQNLMQSCCSTCSVILNVMATQHTCSLNGRVYGPHWPVQGSHHCSCMCIPVHSPWLPGCTDVVQTVVVILTRAGLFPARPCMCVYTYSTVYTVQFYNISTVDCS